MSTFLDNPPRPPRSWRKVVVFVLLGLGVLLVALVAGLYYAVMHTSLPFKMVESMLADAGTNGDFKVEGLSGSISDGFKIKSIRWDENGTNPGEIRDVRVAYSGFWDLLGGHRAILKEIHVGRAHLDITGMESIATNGTMQTTFHSSRRGPGLGQPFQRTSGLFQIDRIGIEDVFITNRVTGFSLVIPAMEWTGFKVSNGKVELGQLKVDGDRLKIATVAGRTVDVGGQQVAFQKKLEGTLLPRLHKSIRQPIDFTLDAGTAKGKLIWRLTAFDGHLDAYQGADRSGYIRCQDLDLTAYFDASVPQALTMQGLINDKGENGDWLKLNSGSFRLGLADFEVRPHEPDPGQMETKIAALRALSRIGGEEFTYQLTIPDQVWKARQSLEAKPPMSAQDTIARVFFGKRYKDLSSEEKQDVDKKVPAFLAARPAQEAEAQ
jgi:hypothetical protein